MQSWIYSESWRSLWKLPAWMQSLWTSRQQLISMPYGEKSQLFYILWALVALQANYVALFLKLVRKGLDAGGHRMSDVPCTVRQMFSGGRQSAVYRECKSEYYHFQFSESSNSQFFTILNWNSLCSALVITPPAAIWLTNGVKDAPRATITIHAMIKEFFI